MINHEAQLELVCTRAQELISSSHFGSEDVVIKRRALQNAWEELKALSTERNKKLNDSLQAHQVFIILCMHTYRRVNKSGFLFHLNKCLLLPYKYIHA